MPPDAKLSGLTRRLVLDGLLDEGAALEAQAESKKKSSISVSTWSPKN